MVETEGRHKTIFVGVDWAAAHNDVLVTDESGSVLDRGRFATGASGLAQLHPLVGDHADQPAQVILGIAIDRGRSVDPLLGGGYQVYGGNPLAASRYRDRHTTSAAKSDASDAKLLADLVRTDRHDHRPLAGDADEAGAIRVLARAHQALIWARQRQVNARRAALREYVPAALEAFDTDLAQTDALAILSVAPTPARARALSRAKIAAALRRAGRQRNIEQRATELQTALRTTARGPSRDRRGLRRSKRGAGGGIGIAQRPDRRARASALKSILIVTRTPRSSSSLPGLGVVLGARVRGEFGDDPTRFTDTRARKADAQNRRDHQGDCRGRIVLARMARNRRLAAACDWWAFCSLTQSPGARRYYDALRLRGKTHSQATRQLANRWVGILHACLERREAYREDVAWRESQEVLHLVA